MALVFRCDGCGQLEGHDSHNRWQSEKAGTVMFIQNPDKFSTRDDAESKNHDLCKECLESFKKWLKGLMAVK